MSADTSKTALNGAGRVLNGAGPASDAGYLDELTELVELHARAQGLRPKSCARLLADIREPSGEGPGSWPSVWSAAGERDAVAGRHDRAAKLFNLARFPYVDGPGRAAAHRRCVAEFDHWAQPAGYERRVVSIGEGKKGEGSGSAVVWTATPAGSAGKHPLLVVTGGIVSIKEQWGNLLGLAGRMGMTVAVTEMPGVGENTVRYDAQAWRFYPDLLDDLAAVADSDQAYLLALSFSGHLALRASVDDRRIRGIATVGAPVAAFFQDKQWFARLPETTVRTLSHLTGTARADLPELLAPWALTDELLGALDIPVHYVASRRDEIIPAADPALLARTVPGARVVEHDDVHGSPRHLLETRLWIARSLLSMRGLGGSPPGIVLGCLASLVRASSALKSVVPVAGNGSKSGPSPQIATGPKAARSLSFRAGVPAGSAKPIWKVLGGRSSRSAGGRARR